MRMDPTDIADVTGAVLRYLVNGKGAKQGWSGDVVPDEPVRLRFVNAAGMSFFNVRIPDLPMTVVAADGQDVRPVTVGEFQIGPGETYDAIVTPTGPRAWPIVAESMDRSGMALGWLAPLSNVASAPPLPVPPLRERPLLTMKDMGMDMPGMDMKGMKMRDHANAPQVKMGPGVEMINPMPMDRTGDPGIGLDGWHRVLTYRDLVARAQSRFARARTHDRGSPDRSHGPLHVVDGRHDHERGARADLLRTGERVRVTLINDTMMAHPIHLHGHLFELVTGHGDHSPRKHTVTVLPGGKVSFDTTAQPGDWVFHCHLFLHMAMGMMRVVKCARHDPRCIRDRLCRPCLRAADCRGAGRACDASRHGDGPGPAAPPAGPPPAENASAPDGTGDAGTGTGAGTDQAPGTAPPPAPVHDRAADRFWGADAMAHAEMTMMGGHSAPVFRRADRPCRNRAVASGGRLSLGRRGLDRRRRPPAFAHAGRRADRRTARTGRDRGGLVPCTGPWWNLQAG
jgi:hypothetical protein